MKEKQPVSIMSSCIYCGCGCRLNYEVNDNKIIRVMGVKSDPVSDGAPCIKGLTINEVFNKNRITEPLINGKPVSLDEIFDYVYEKTKNLAPNELFFNTSGKVTNEDNYVIEKFARTCYQTPNIDSCCGRLCHNATVMGMNNVFGTPNLTNLNNINEIDTLLIIGSEPEKNYPVFYNKLIRNNSIKVIRVHSFIKGCNPNECIITIKPGTEACLLNGVLHELINKGLKSEFEGFDLLRKITSTYDKKLTCKECGLTEEDYDNMIKLLIKSKRLGLFHGMGLTQQVNSIENIHSLLNLALLKKGVMLTLRGEINVQGAGDVYGSACNNHKCKPMNMIESLMLSPVKTAFLTEFDPLKSMPDSEQVSQKLDNMFLVYFGSYYNTTAMKADVVIPIASLLESEGTITNGERRVRKVNPVIKGPLQSWQVLSEFSKKFNKSNEFNYSSSRQVFEELKKNVKDYQSINTNHLWGGSDEWPDKSIKHKRFMPEPYDGRTDPTSNKYPFILTTYRSKHSFLSDEVTGQSQTLKKNQEEPGFYFNPEDMKELGLTNGSRITIISTTNKVKSKAYINERLPRGIIGAYIHYSKPLVNKLFPLRFDEESFTPNYKRVAVRIELD